MPDCLGVCVVLVSAGLGARRLTRSLGVGLRSPLAGAIAWGTLLVAWALFAAFVPATVSLFFDAPLVRIPLIAAVSVALLLAVVLFLRTEYAPGCAGCRPPRGAAATFPGLRFGLVSLAGAAGSECQPGSECHSGLEFLPGEASSLGGRATCPPGVQNARPHAGARVLSRTDAEGNLFPPLRAVFQTAAEPFLAFFAVSWRPALVVLLPVVALHAFLLVEAMLRPPVSSDGIYYHIPLAVKWLKQGQLSMVPGALAYSLPGNGELWQMFFAGTGIERLIELAMWPIGLLLAAVVAGIARELGVPRRVAATCALLVLVSPMVGLQMYGSYVDVFGAAFLLGGLYWALRLARADASSRERQAAAGLAGLSVGLAVGTKFTLVAWAAPVGLAVAAALAVRRWGKSEKVRKWESKKGGSAENDTSGEPGGGFEKPAVFWPLVLFALCTLPGGAFWYLRNGWVTGWPLYPVKLSLFGWSIGVGQTSGDICTDLASEGWRSLLYPWIEWKKSGYPYTQDNGLGPMFAALAVVGVAYLLIRLVQQFLPGQRRRRRLAPAVMVLGFVAIGVVLYVHVCFSYARYALALWPAMLAASAPAMALMLRRWPRGSRALLGAMVTLSAAMIGLWPLKTLVGRVQDGQMSRAAIYDVPELFDHLPPGTVVLNMGEGPANYPLLGANWTNELIESFCAGPFGLNRPLTKAALEQNRVEYVFAKNLPPGAPLFSGDVVYEEIAPGPVYRINSSSENWVVRRDEPTLSGVTP